MSYILEALKKSQQQRELGRAPRLEENWLEQMPDRERPHPWVIGTAVLAALALLIALYAVLRSGAAPQTPVPSPAIESSQTLSAQSGLTAPGSGNGDALGASSQPPPVTEDPANLSVEPNLLIVPAPDPQGRPLPRGADEIRRAVLGEEFSPSDSQPAPADHPQEAQVPEDLKAEIEAFKQAVKQRSGDERNHNSAPGAASKAESPEATLRSAPPSNQAKAEPAASTPEPTNTTAPGPTMASGPSPALRQRLPPYSVSVHIYNSTEAKRFVYINGNKMREQDVTPEGLKIEEITQAGVILSFEGEHFFERR